MAHYSHCKGIFCVLNHRHIQVDLSPWPFLPFGLSPVVTVAVLVWIPRSNFFPVESIPSDGLFVWWGEGGFNSCWVAVRRGLCLLRKGFPCCVQQEIGDLTQLNWLAVDGNSGEQFHRYVFVAVNFKGEILRFQCNLQKERIEWRVGNSTDRKIEC